MKTYVTLIKQAKAEMTEKQKELEQVYKDALNLEHQIEHLIETLEREQTAVSQHKIFVNPTYFDRLTNKIKAYRHLLQTKNEELSVLQFGIRELFSIQKKYEFLLESSNHKKRLAHQKQEAEELEGLFRPQE